MPIRNRKRPICVVYDLLALWEADVGGLRVESNNRQFFSWLQLRIDGAGKWVRPLSPLGVEQPQHRGALAAEVALGFCSGGVRRVAVHDRFVLSNVLRAFDFEGVGVSAKVDRAAVAAGLATYRAHAQLVGNWGVGFDCKPNFAAVAAAFEFDWHGLAGCLDERDGKGVGSLGPS